jgi:hypothetical protein
LAASTKGSEILFCKRVEFSCACSCALVDEPDTHKLATNSFVSRIFSQVPLSSSADLVRRAGVSRRSADLSARKGMALRVGEGGHHARRVMRDHVEVRKWRQVALAFRIHSRQETDRARGLLGRASGGEGSWHHRPKEKLTTACATKTHQHQC